MTIRERCHNSPPKVRVSNPCLRLEIENIALDEAERYYGKDALVPPAWAKWLADAIPEPIQALGSGDMMSYLRDSVLRSNFDRR